MMTFYHVTWHSQANFIGFVWNVSSDAENLACERKCLESHEGYIDPVPRISDFVIFEDIIKYKIFLILYSNIVSKYYVY